MKIGCFALVEPFASMARQFKAIAEMGIRYEVDATPDHALVLGSALEAANRSIPAAIAQ